MYKSANGQTLARRALPKPKDRFTGERLKVLRPEVYRQVVDLLAEPRAHVPYDHICRLLHVSEHTLKAIERAQAIPIAERKERLLAKALRVASKAIDRVEDQIDGANITQATIAFGVATEKALLLAGEPLQRLELNLTTQPQDICAEMRALTVQITEALKPPASPPLLMSSFAPGDGDGVAADGSANISASDQKRQRSLVDVC